MRSPAHAPPPAARDHLVNLLGAFVTAIDDELQQVLEAEVGAGGAGSAALLALDTWPDRSIDFLAHVLGRSHSGTVRLVDRLVMRGLVERGPGPDGRTAAVGLTPAGRAVVRRARRARHRVLAALVEGMRVSERRAMATALDRLLREGSRSRFEARRACRLCDHTVCRGDACPIGMSAEED